jgi:predicted O-methyltransferase YrrM
MSFDPVAPAVGAFLDGLVAPRVPELAAMEAEAARTDFPIIGPAAGHFAYLLARLIGARRIFELGSGYGYSTAWFARAVVENGGGIVHHTVWDRSLSDRARIHLGKLGFEAVVQYHVGEAVETLRRSDGPFDLIFNDIDKVGYPASLPVIRGKLRPGGILITDNLLWHGRIFDPADQSADTEGVRELTRLVTGDPAWTATIVPIRDGILVARLTDTTA